MRPFRNVDDTLGVIYTHGFAGLAGGLLTGVFADPKMVIYLGVGKTADITPFAGLIHGSATLLKEQVWAGLWMSASRRSARSSCSSSIGLVVPLRMSEEDMEEGDLAVHGHEVYPSDVPVAQLPERRRPGRPTRAGPRRRHG